MLIFFKTLFCYFHILFLKIDRLYFLTISLCHSLLTYCHCWRGYQSKAEKYNNVNKFVSLRNFKTLSQGTKMFPMLGLVTLCDVKQIVGLKTDEKVFNSFK